jgi:hypothetical protein
MANKNPYSLLNPEARIYQRRPEWAERIQTLIEGKPIIPIQVRFFIDGYRFYKICQKEAKRQEEYVHWLYENWTNSTVPDIDIGPEVLNNIGRQLIRASGESIVDSLINLNLDEGDSIILASDAVISAIEESSPKLVERINDASAIIDPFSIVDIFGGAKPNIRDIQRRLWQDLHDYQGTKGDRGWKSIEENLKLLSEGKFRDKYNKIRNIEEYSQFINGFDVDAKLDQAHLAITKYQIEGGRVALNEKGVDAKLILALIDAMDEKAADAMCLFTNDTDYYPVIERIKENTHIPVFLATLDGDYRLSRELRQIVGEEKIVNVNARRVPWPEVSDSPVFELAEHQDYMYQFNEEMEERYKIIEAEWDEYIRRETESITEDIE